MKKKTPLKKRAMRNPDRGTSITKPTQDMIVSGRARQVIQGADDSRTQFGPGQPLPAQTPENPRIFDYDLQVNTNIQPRNAEPVSFAQLRAMADNFDILRAIIETRKDQVKSNTWIIRKRREPGESVESQLERSSEDANTKMLTAFFAKPDGAHSWTQWIGAVCEDLFVTDAPSVLVQRTFGGEIAALHVIDGATIEPKITEAGLRPAPPDVAYQQVIKGVPWVDLTTDDLIYRPRNYRAHKIYGYGPVEQAIMTINIALRREISQAEFYRSGSVPEGFALLPETWSQSQVKDFQKYWDALMSGNLAQRRKLMFLPGLKGLEFPKIDVKQDSMDEWLVRILCFFFSIAPTPFVKMLSRNVASNQTEQSMQEGLKPTLDYITELVNEIIQSPRYFNMPDQEFAYEQQVSLDPIEQANVDKIRVGSGLDTINEVRERDGKDPVEGGDVPGIITATGLIPLSAYEDHKAQAEQEAQNAVDQKGVQEDAKQGKPVSQSSKILKRVDQKKKS